jgi:triacylglycerol esterase/lipase EstA (alpha/beta hydrolase family)
MPGRDHVYLVPGFFGFTKLGEIRYFAHVLDFLRTRAPALGVRAETHVVRTHPTASLPERAARVVETIAETMGRDGAVHLIGHSSGGLDVRLAVAPGVSLPSTVDAERVARRVRTVVTVATPHHGTPLASFFASLLGQRLLGFLSLWTAYVLRFGRLPISVVARLGTVYARLDDHVGLNIVLLDQLFGQLLADFSPTRRHAVETFLASVSRDQALLPQVTPEGMEVFNATTRDRPGVRYGSVVTRAHPPGMRSTLAAGLDPSAQATHALYQALYRLASRTPRGRISPLAAAQARRLRRAYGTLPGPGANDGIVPTRSQPWGDVIHAAQADHLDVIGHFYDRADPPRHADWLTTGSGFDAEHFEAVWADVVGYVLGRRARP